MDIVKYRKIALLPPIKKKMTYLLSGDCETNGKRFSFRDVTDSILEQLRICVDEKGGIYNNDNIEIKVCVKYKKQK